MHFAVAVEKIPATRVGCVCARVPGTRPCGRQNLRAALDSVKVRDRPPARPVSLTQRSHVVDLDVDPEDEGDVTRRVCWEPGRLRVLLRRCGLRTFALVFVCAALFFFSVFFWFVFSSLSAAGAGTQAGRVEGEACEVGSQKESVPHRTQRGARGRHRCVGPLLVG